MFPSQQPGLWQNLFGNQNVGGTNLQSTIPNYPFAPYQVASGDTFDSIAQTNNLTTQQIQQANGGMLVPPPAGRMINLPAKPVGYGAPAGYGPYWQQQRNQNLQTSYYKQVANDLIAQGRNIPPNTSGGIIDRAQSEAHNAQNQLSNNIKPPTISASAAQYMINPATGVPATVQEFTQMGYSLNPATGVYTLGGANAQLPGGVNVPGTGGTNTDFTNTGFMQRYAEKGTAFTEQKRWDPVRKKFIKIGQLINEGKLNVKTGRFNPRGHRKGGGGQQVQAQMPQPEIVLGAGTTPTQQLNINRPGG